MPASYIHLNIHIVSFSISSDRWRYMCWREAALKWSSASLQDFFPAPPASVTHARAHNTRNKESLMCAARAKWQTCPVVSALSSCKFICYTDFRHSFKKTKQIETKKKKKNLNLFFYFSAHPVALKLDTGNIQDLSRLQDNPQFL